MLNEEGIEKGRVKMPEGKRLDYRRINVLERPWLRESKVQRQRKANAVPMLMLDA